MVRFIAAPASVVALMTCILVLAACGDTRISDAETAKQMAAAGDLTAFSYSDGPYFLVFGGMFCVPRPDGIQMIRLPGRNQHPIAFAARLRGEVLAELVHCGFFAMDHHYQAWLGNVGNLDDGGDSKCELTAATSTGLRNHVVCYRRFTAGMAEFRRFFAALVVREGLDRGDLSLGALAPYNHHAADAAILQQQIMDQQGDLMSLSFCEGAPSAPGYQFDLRAGDAHADAAADLVTPAHTVVAITVDPATRRNILVALDQCGFFGYQGTRTPAESPPSLADDERLAWPVYTPAPVPLDYACIITATTHTGLHAVSAKGLLPPRMRDLRDYLRALIVDRGWDPQAPRTATGLSVAP